MLPNIKQNRLPQNKFNIGCDKRATPADIGYGALVLIIFRREKDLFAINLPEMPSRVFGISPAGFRATLMPSFWGINRVYQRIIGIQKLSTVPIAKGSIL